MTKPVMPFAAPSCNRQEWTSRSEWQLAPPTADETSTSRLSQLCSDCPRQAAPRSAQDHRTRATSSFATESLFGAPARRFARQFRGVGSIFRHRQILLVRSLNPDYINDTVWFYLTSGMGAVCKVSLKPQGSGAAVTKPAIARLRCNAPASFGARPTDPCDARAAEQRRAIHG